MGIKFLLQLIRVALFVGLKPGVLDDKRVGWDGMSGLHSFLSKDSCRRPYVYRKDCKPIVRKFMSLVKKLAGTVGTLAIFFDGNNLPGKGVTLSSRRSEDTMQNALSVLRRRVEHWVQREEGTGEAEPCPLQNEDDWVDAAAMMSADEEQRAGDADNADPVPSLGDPSDEEVKQAYKLIGKSSTHSAKNYHVFSHALCDLPRRCVCILVLIRADSLCFCCALLVPTGRELHRLRLVCFLDGGAEKLPSRRQTPRGAVSLRKRPPILP